MSSRIASQFRLLVLFVLATAAFEQRVLADSLCRVTNFPVPDAGDYNTIDPLGDVGGRLLFRANTLGLESGLWATDGSQAGTTALAAASSYAAQAGWSLDRVNAGSAILHSDIFGQVDGGHTWRTDGTPQGTWQVVDAKGVPFLLGGLIDLAGKPHGFACIDTQCRLYEIRNEKAAIAVQTLPGPGYPRDVAAFADTALAWIDNTLWRLRPGAPAEELGLRSFSYAPTAETDSYAVLWLPYAANGTLYAVGRTGPPIVLVTESASAGQYPQLSVLGDRVYFAFDDRVHGQELWSTDGTKAGTRRETNFAPSQPFEEWSIGATPFGIMFVADDGQGARLFRLVSPGVVEPLQKSCGSRCNRFGGGFETVGGKVVFTSSDPATGGEPWVSDGTLQGTKLIKDFCPGPCSGGYVMGASASSALINVSNGIQREIWSTDGTPQQARKLATVPANSRYVRWFRGLSTVAANPEGSNELHLLRIGGASTQWRIVKIPRYGFGQPVIRPEAVGNTVTFLNRDNQYQAVDLAGNVSSPSGPRRGCSGFDPSGEYGWDQCRPRLALGKMTYFIADSATGTGLWRTDGTATGLSSVAQGIDYDWLFHGLQPWKAGLAWIGERSLWVSDGTTDGTRRLLDWRGDFEYVVGPYPGRSSDELLFAAQAPDGIKNFWRTDGTVAGTQQLTDYSVRRSFGRPVIAGGAAYVVVGPDYPYSGPSDLLRFAAGASGAEVLRSFHDIGPLMTAGNPRDRVVFTARRGQSFDRTLWSIRGTEFRSLKNYKPTGFGSQYLDHDRMTEHDGKVFGVLSVGNSGRELWVTDGTAAGTRGLDLEPGGASALPEDLRSTSRGLVFSAYNVTRGRELWSSDGTAAGTRRVADLNPGVPSAWPTPVAELAGRVYFGATSPDRAAQLWMWTKGTCANP